LNPSLEILKNLGAVEVVIISTFPFFLDEKTYEEIFKKNSYEEI
jgi:phosphoribosylpyrophosphate synthetase